MNRQQDRLTKGGESISAFRILTISFKFYLSG